MIESGCKEGTRVQKCPTESSQHAALTFLNARRDVLVDARQCGTHLHRQKRTIGRFCPLFSMRSFLDYVSLCSSCGE